MNKTSWLLIVLFILLLVMTMLPGVSDKTVSVEGRSVKIGALLSLTGRFATFGEDTKNGIELARAELSTRGIALDVVYEDATSDPKIGLTGATKLSDVDEVPIIIAGPGSSVNLAVTPELEKRKKIFIVNSATPKLNSAGPYTFKTLPDVDPEIEKMIPYMIARGIKNLGILYDSTSDTQVYAQELASKKFESYVGHKAVSQGFDGKNSDYRTQISQLKQSNPDALYILAPEKNAGIAVKQIRELGLGQPIFGWSGIVGGEFFKTAGNSSNGVIVTDQPFSCEGTVLMKKYCMDYKLQNPNFIPLTYGAHAYDVIMIIGSILENNPLLTGAEFEEAIADALTNRTYVGVSGDLSFDIEGNITKHEFEFRVVEGGRFIPVE